MKFTGHSEFGGSSRCEIIKNIPLSQIKTADRQGSSPGHWRINISASPETGNRHVVTRD